MSGRTERKALVISAWGNLFFAALGIGFAITSRSNAILLDGIFSVIAFLMALLSIKVVELVEQPDDEFFHFGYASFESLLNTIKGFIILGVCAFSLFSSIEAIAHGGREMNVGWALVYSIVACLGAAFLATVQGRAARETGSPVLEVDSHSWRVDAAMSAGVGVAFVVALWLSTTQWSAWVDYVDPVLVAVLCLVMIALPLRIVRDGLGELLLESPAREVQAEIESRFDEITQRFPFDEKILRMTRIGRRSVLMAHIVVSEDFRLQSVTELDAIRKEVVEGIQELHPSWTVDVIFVADEKYVY